MARARKAKVLGVGGKVIKQPGGSDAPMRRFTGTLSAADRRSLPRTAFAIPEERGYPIPNASHARNALTRVAQYGSPAEQRRVRAAVRRRFPSIGG